jgi:hypothetical protein
MNVKHLSMTFVVGTLLAMTTGCADRDIVSIDRGSELTEADTPALLQGGGAASDQACWGQATRVFAAMGAMGEHASSYDTPRVGLRNLARTLYELGLIPDDSMQSLGAFVATAEQLSIDACM